MLDNADMLANTTITSDMRLNVQLRGGNNAASTIASSAAFVAGKGFNTDSVHRIQRQLFARSERVKGIDFHPTEPWILTTLYSGMSWLAHDVMDEWDTD